LNNSKIFNLGFARRYILMNKKLRLDRYLTERFLDWYSFLCTFIIAKF
jgi:hypothetical protein